MLTYNQLDRLHIAANFMPKRWTKAYSGCIEQSETIDSDVNLTFTLPRDHGFKGIVSKQNAIPSTESAHNQVDQRLASLPLTASRTKNFLYQVRQTKDSTAILFNDQRRKRLNNWYSFASVSGISQPGCVPLSQGLVFEPPSCLQRSI